jgi:hypothetical protein
VPRKVFVAGEILTAADVNTNLMDQSVMVFAGSAARGSAIPSPSEGMVTYRSDDDVVEVYDGSAYKAVGPGKILQVVSTAKTDTFSSSSTSMTDITGLSVSITPSSTSSKVLVTFNVNLGTSVNDFRAYQLVRDSTAIAIGDTAGSRIRSTMGHYLGGDNVAGHIAAHSMTFLDSPNTTSATTYKVQGRTPSGTFFVNRNSQDTDGASIPRAVSTITVMEVAG